MSSFYQVPLNNTEPWYDLQIQLSGVIYKLTFRYNGRAQRWFMDIADPSGNNILDGQPVLTLRNVTGQYLSLAIPPGVFFAVDNTGDALNPTLYSFGATHTFYYQDPDS